MLGVLSLSRCISAATHVADMFFYSFPWPAIIHRSRDLLDLVVITGHGAYRCNVRQDLSAHLSASRWPGAFSGGCAIAELRSLDETGCSSSTITKHALSSSKLANTLKSFNSAM